MHDYLTSTHPSFKPGDHVIIPRVDAQEAVGGDHGIVVGDTTGQPHAHGGKVIVAVDGCMTNAVIAPDDLQHAQ